MNGIITNITNVVETEKDSFAEFRMTGRCSAAPNVGLRQRRPFTQRSTFDLNLSVRTWKIPKANPWLREYLKADADAGGFDLYLEVASSNGRYKGYAKPMLEDVQFLSLEEVPKENPLKSCGRGTLQLAVQAVRISAPEADRGAGSVQRHDHGRTRPIYWRRSRVCCATRS